MRIAIGVLVLALLLGGGYVLMNRSGGVACKDTDLRIVAVGDSLVEGYGATEGNDLVSLLSKKVGLPIENEGVSGNTSADVRARIARALTTNPDIVIVLIGGNDALRKTPLAETEGNIGAILAEVQKVGAAPLLLGVVGGFPQDPYARMFTRLRDQYDAAYVPNVLSGVIGRQEFMSDAIHPNDAGYARIAERVAPVLESVCADRS